MEFEISTLAQRPSLLGDVWSLNPTWPEFMYHGPVGDSHYGGFVDTFHDFTMVATESGRVVARGHSVPFALDLPGRKQLPPGGWDRILIWAFDDHRRRRKTDIVSAVEVVINPDYRGQGLSTQMLRAMSDNAREKGYGRLVVPVRPAAKHEEPHTPMDDYLARTGADGLPQDPWLRTHVRIGGKIVGVAPSSMVVPGSLQQWREWTGLPFDTDGAIAVPGGLAPVLCSLQGDCAVYVEPNIWVEHKLT
ncbi:GNAT family N-acetyltransferase [Streptomyces oceani]|uniref:Acetyltransferase-like protein n=1 Tax=Streptomyces oceani TaxID=1075402 RepID=A0A1E7KPC3_9ACTN|nr:GNAT family N-acetyltransferase [Streptomyces oceani]OEV05743.1 acetyltransferase-like protein [Streptomyces oceani]